MCFPSAAPDLIWDRFMSSAWSGFVVQNAYLTWALDRNMYVLWKFSFKKNTVFRCYQKKLLALLKNMHYIIIEMGAYK